MFSNQKQEITFKIKNIEYNIKISYIYFNQDGTLKTLTVYNLEPYTGDFFYEGKKYNLTFNNGESISFKPNGELDESCINNSIERYNKIFGDRLSNLEKEQNNMKKNQKIVKISDIVLIVIYIGISFALLSTIIWWHPTLTDNVIKFKNDKYIFLYEIFKRSPTIIMVVVGFKFLQLAFERIRIVGEVEKVNKFIKLTDDKNIKNKLLEKIAIPFFSPKKIKNVFFEKLTDDISIDTKNTDKNNL